MGTPHLKKMSSKKTAVCIAAGVLCLAVLLAVGAALLLHREESEQESGSKSEPQYLEQAELARWGISFKMEGSLPGESRLTAEETDNSVTLRYRAELRNALQQEKPVEGFGFHLDGVPECLLYCDSTLRVKNVFLKAGNYARLVRISVAEAAFMAGAYYVSEDGKTFTLAMEYNEADADKYYKLEKLGTVEADYYPLVWSLSSISAAEGLRYSGTADKNSLYRIAAALTNALANGVRVDTSVPEGEPNVTVFQVTGAAFQPSTEMKSWVKFNEEGLTWSHDEHTPDRVAELVLAALQDGESIVVKYAGLEINEQLPGSASLLGEKDHCVDTVFEWEIRFRTE